MRISLFLLLRLHFPMRLQQYKMYIRLSQLTSLYSSVKTSYDAVTNVNIILFHKFSIKFSFIPLEIQYFNLISL